MRFHAVRVEMNKIGGLNFLLVVPILAHLNLFNHSIEVTLGQNGHYQQILSAMNTSPKTKSLSPRIINLGCRDCSLCTHVYFRIILLLDLQLVLLILVSSHWPIHCNVLGLQSFYAMQKKKLDSHKGFEISHAVMKICPTRQSMGKL